MHEAQISLRLLWSGKNKVLRYIEKIAKRHHDLQSNIRWAWNLWVEKWRREEISGNQNLEELREEYSTECYLPRYMIFSSTWHLLRTPKNVKFDMALL
jgi:hypothetical protein